MIFKLIAVYAVMKNEDCNITGVSLHIKRNVPCLTSDYRVQLQIHFEITPLVSHSLLHIMHIPQIVAALVL